jgi:hypothetical protein
MRHARIVTVCAAFAFSALYSTGAFATGASAALLLGDGFRDYFNVGIGARAGYTLPMGVYVGGTFVYHLGKNEPMLGGDSKVNVYYFGAEGGYEMGAGPLTLRPYAGIGYAIAAFSRPGYSIGSVPLPPVSGSEGKGALWPGVTAIFPIGNLFVGGDARYVVVLDAEDVNAFCIFATGGMTF